MLLLHTITNWKQMKGNKMMEPRKESNTTTHRRQIVEDKYGRQNLGDKTWETNEARQDQDPNSTLFGEKLQKGKNS